MKTLSFRLGVVGASLLAAACGSDGGGSGSSSPTASASASVSSAQTLESGARDGVPEDTLAGAMALQAQLQGLVAQKQAAAMQKAATSPAASAGAAFGAMQGALNAACLNQSGANQTYTNCQESGATFNGTVNANGDQVAIDLTIDVDPAAAASATGQTLPMGGPVKGVKVGEKGVLTMTPTLIQGDLNVTIDTEVELAQVGLPAGIPGIPSSMHLQSTVKATFDVTLLDGCAVGGTLVVDSTFQGTSAGTQSVRATATFGPACGDVVVE